MPQEFDPAWEYYQPSAETVEALPHLTESELHIGLQLSISKPVKSTRAKRVLVPANNLPLVEGQCPVCLKSFEPIVRHQKRKYCSHRCGKTAAQRAYVARRKT